jgi:hypothetical protein
LAGIGGVDDRAGGGEPGRAGGGGRGLTGGIDQACYWASVTASGGRGRWTPVEPGDVAPAIVCGAYWAPWASPDKTGDGILMVRGSNINVTHWACQTRRGTKLKVEPALAVCWRVAWYAGQTLTLIGGVKYGQTFGHLHCVDERGTARRRARR